jgi:hypothetical protein
LPAANAHAKRRADLAAGVLGLARRTRRGGRVVDRAALEMRSTRKCTGGSNPSLSANDIGYLVDIIRLNLQRR